MVLLRWIIRRCSSSTYAVPIPPPSLGSYRFFWYALPCSIVSRSEADKSAVTHAQVNFPQYHDAIIKYGPEKCIDTLLQAIESIDKLLDLPEPIPSLVKGLFGLEGLSDNADFGEVISSPLGYWQAKNWDPAGESP